MRVALAASIVAKSSPASIAASVSHAAVAVGKTQLPLVFDQESRTGMETRQGAGTPTVAERSAPVAGVAVTPIREGAYSAGPWKVKVAASPSATAGCVSFQPCGSESAKVAEAGAVSPGRTTQLALSVKAYCPAAPPGPMGRRT